MEIPKMGVKLCMYLQNKTTQFTIQFSIFFS